MSVETAATTAATASTLATLCGASRGCWLVDEADDALSLLRITSSHCFVVFSPKLLLTSVHLLEAP